LCDGAIAVTRPLLFAPMAPRRAKSLTSLAQVRAAGSFFDLSLNIRWTRAADLS
jgi:hypothetical protein